MTAPCPPEVEAKGSNELQFYFSLVENLPPLNFPISFTKQFN